MYYSYSRDMKKHISINKKHIFLLIIYSSMGEDRKIEKLYV